MQPYRPKLAQAAQHERVGMFNTVKQFVDNVMPNRNSILGAVASIAAIAGGPLAQTSEARSLKSPNKSIARKYSVPLAESFANSNDGDGREIYTIDYPDMSAAAQINLPNPVISGQPIDAHLTLTYKKDVKFKGSRVVPDDLETRSGRHKLKKNATVDGVFGKRKPMVFQIGGDSAASITWASITKPNIFAPFNMGSEKIFVNPGESKTVDKVLGPLDCDVIDPNYVFNGVPMGGCSPASIAIDLYASISGRDKNMTPLMPKGTTVSRSLDQRVEFNAAHPVRISQQQ